MCREVYQQHRDNQNAFRITDVKKRKKLLGKVLKIPEFNEEDDWRLGILLDIHKEIFTLFVNSGFPWSDSTVGGISKFMKRSTR